MSYLSVILSCIGYVCMNSAILEVHDYVLLILNKLNEENNTTCAVQEFSRLANFSMHILSVNIYACVWASILLKQHIKAICLCSHDIMGL